MLQLDYVSFRLNRWDCGQLADDFVLAMWFWKKIYRNVFLRNTHGKCWLGSICLSNDLILIFEDYWICFIYLWTVLYTIFCNFHAEFYTHAWILLCRVLSWKSYQASWKQFWKFTPVSQGLTEINFSHNLFIYFRFVSLELFWRLLVNWYIYSVKTEQMYLFIFGMYFFWGITLNF
jgi:hypothetical protein